MVLRYVYNFATLLFFIFPIGCATLEVDPNLALPFKDSKKCNAISGSISSPFSVGSVQSVRDTNSFSVPEELKKDKVMNDLLGHWSFVDESKPTGFAIQQKKFRLPKMNKMEFTDGQIKDFTKAFAEIVLSPKSYVPTYDEKGTLKPGFSLSKPTDILNVFGRYYSAYLQGDFVDRTGTKLSKPEVKNVIGNKTIGAVLMVFLEAFGDLTLKTPILYKGKLGSGEQWYPSLKKNKPTSIAEGIITAVQVGPDTGTCGITEKEAKAIGLLSNYAGDSTSMLQKALLETFGDLEGGVVFVSGHLSIGDNETLSTIAATLLESVARRGVERLSYQFYWDHSHTPTPGGGFTTANPDRRSKSIKAMDDYLDSL